MVSREIGPYWIMEKIGESRIGPVFKGMHKTLDQEAAVTVVDAELLADGAVTTRFLARCGYLKTLSHRNVVKFIDCVHDGENVFLLTDLVPGETLADKIAREGALSVDAARGVFLPVLDALHYMHGKGIPHGNLRSEDVIVGPDGAVQVKGFGLAFLSGTQSASEAVTPTALEAAEVAHDVHTVGVMLAESLSESGCASCAASGASSTSLPRALQVVIERALCADESKRYQDARTFARELRGAPGAAASTAGMRFALRDWGKPASMALLLLALLPVAYAIFYHQPHQTPRKEAFAPAPAQPRSPSVPSPAPAPAPHPAQAPPVPPPEAVPSPAGSASAVPVQKTQPSRVAEKTTTEAARTAGSQKVKAHHKKKRKVKSHTRYAKLERREPVAATPIRVVVPAPFAEKEPWQIRK